MARGKPKEAEVPEESSGPIKQRRRIVDDKAANKVFEGFARRQVMYETADEIDIQNAVYLRTGCLPFDLITGGKGIPRGRVGMLHSQPGAGKSTLLFTAARGLCRSGARVLYIDVESSDDTAHQMGLMGKPEQLTVPQGSFRYQSVTTYAELEAVLDAFVTSSFDIVFIDSLTAITISRAANKKAGKTVEDQGALGVDARVQTMLLKQFYAQIKDTDQAGYYIVQERNKINLRMPQLSGPQAAGSEQSKFVSNITVRVKPSTLIKEGVRVIGRNVNLYAEKCRHAPPFINIPATVLFGKGVSNIDMLADAGKFLGIFEPHGTNWCIKIPGQHDETVRGHVGLSNWIKAPEHYPALVDVFYDNSLDYLNYLGNGGKSLAPDGSTDYILSGAQQSLDSGDNENGEDITEDEVDQVLSLSDEESEE